ncbi:MAG: type II toxin-antitoxin system VapC family toxin [Planctomycetes bacterium]|nr:type II toxin-antitoxin system VapC family toxin [Planctomycetota bacterium]
MSLYVVDSSVALKWYFNEEHTEAARRVLRPEHERLAPELLLLEFDAALCKRVRRGLLTEADADDIRAALRRSRLLLYPQSLLLNAAYEIAKEVRRSPYDCLYLALADLLGERMVTADRRFYEAILATPFRECVVWVEDVP